jgi:hypothetical protein
VAARAAKRTIVQPEFAPVAIPEAWFSLLESLRRHRVQFVIAGSAADAIVEGTPQTAARLVVAPAPYRRNLERVAKAFRERTLRVRSGDDETQPLEPQQIVEHPALRWPLVVGGIELDLIGSAVGDGEFSIRVWRTRPIELIASGGSIVAEVELLADSAPVTA